jgi:hypothetical protein
VLVEFSGIPLKVCTQKPRTNWVVDVGYEAQMEEARHSLSEIKIFFSTTRSKTTFLETKNDF